RNHGVLGLEGPSHLPATGDHRHDSFHSGKVIPRSLVVKFALDAPIDHGPTLLFTNRNVGAQGLQPVDNPGHLLFGGVGMHHDDHVDGNASALSIESTGWPSARPRPGTRATLGSWTS